MSGLDERQRYGGRIALALLRAAVTDDIDTMNAVSAQAHADPDAVISALASLLAHTLVESAGEERALEAIDAWMLNLVDGQVR